MRLEIGSEEWKKIRRTMITATDVAPIMGLSPYKSALQLYHEKVYGIEQETNYQMERGLRLEPAARSAFNTLHNCNVNPEFIVHPTISYFAASLDGISMDHLIACEIKCPGHLDHSTAACGNVPAHYIPQLQWQMYVAGLSQIFYFSYHPNDIEPCISILVERDDAFIQTAIIAAQGFYDRLKVHNPPEPTEQDTVQIAEPEFLSCELQFKEVNEQIAILTIRRDTIKEYLINACKDQKAKGILFRYNPVKTKGNVKYSEIPELMGVDLDKYRGEDTIRWRIDPIKD